MAAFSRRSKIRVVIVAGIVVLASVALKQCGQTRPARIVLWAWERPENLDFINPREVEVAFLARTIRLRGEETVVKPRLQPLKFAPGTELTAVARIESEAAALSRAQLDEIISAIEPLTQLKGVRAIQIDFDAKASERMFYREFLETLRRKTPAQMRLSITALASWCEDDNWLSGAPIDEAVPMLFRMGPDRDEIRRRLAAGRPLRASLCRNSLGVSTDEPLPKGFRSNVERLYVFHPQSWTAESVGKVLKEQGR